MFHSLCSPSGFAFVPLVVSGNKGFQMRPRHTIFTILAAGMMCGSWGAWAQESGPLRPKDMPNYCYKVAVDTFALKPNKVKVKKAHVVCPYSNATKGNIQVTTTLV